MADLNLNDIARKDALSRTFGRREAAIYSEGLRAIPGSGIGAPIVALATIIGAKAGRQLDQQEQSQLAAELFEFNKNTGDLSDSDKKKELVGIFMSHGLTINDAIDATKEYSDLVASPESSGNVPVSSQGDLQNTLAFLKQHPELEAKLDVDASVIGLPQGSGKFIVKRPGRSAGFSDEGPLLPPRPISPRKTLANNASTMIQKRISELNSEAAQAISKGADPVKVRKRLDNLISQLNNQSTPK